MRATALYNALKIIDIVHKTKNVKYNSLLSELEISGATLSAILNQLTENNYLRKTEEGYSLGYKLITLAYSIIDNLDIRKYAKDEMAILRDNTGETVELIVPDDLSIVFVDKMESDQAIRLKVEIGKQYHDLYKHAPGKLYLAFMDKTLQQKYLQQTESFIKSTQYTITSKTELTNEIKKIYKEKIAFDMMENRIDLVRIAAPILNHESELIGIIGIAAPSYRTSITTAKKHAVYVKQAAYNISKEIGYAKT